MTSEPTPLSNLEQIVSGLVQWGGMAAGVLYHMSKFGDGDPRGIRDTFFSLLVSVLEPLEDRYAATDLELVARALQDVIATASDELILVDPG